jgi:hypothetical protein
MSFATWWRDKSSTAKAITILSTLLILQVGLCFSTPYTLRPMYEAIAHPKPEAYVDLGLMFWQAIFCVLTLAILIITVVIAVVRHVISSYRDRGNSLTIVSGESDKNDKIDN